MKVWIAKPWKAAWACVSPGKGGAIIPGHAAVSAKSGRNRSFRRDHRFSKSPGFGNSTGTPSALQVFAAHRRSRSFGMACTMKW